MLVFIHKSYRGSKRIPLHESKE